MELHFLRNATFIIKSTPHQVLIDPMLSDKGVLPPFSMIKHKAVRNPLVALPDSAEAALDQVTAALITHCQRKHVDHLDKAGMNFLTSRQLPVYCRKGDESWLKKKGMDAKGLPRRQTSPFLDGHIHHVPAVHGHGWVAKLMGPGAGYFITLPNEPSLYIIGDSVLTKDVRQVITDSKPDIIVVAAGNASIDAGDDILMPMEEVLEVIRLAPGAVIANHLEALNHCPVTRDQVHQAAQNAGLRDKLYIPADGEVLKFDA